MGRSIIFLDLDGVLITRESRARAEQRGNLTFIHQQAARFCRESVSHLNQLIRETDAEIALVSDMRRLRSIRGILSVAGLIVRWVATDVPIFQPHGHRGDEVGAWLAACRGIDSYVVLDDQPELYFRNEDVRRRLVVCDPSQGVSAATVKAAAKILAGATVDVDDPVEA